MTNLLGHEISENFFKKQKYTFTCVRQCYYFFEMGENLFIIIPEYVNMHTYIYLDTPLCVNGGDNLFCKKLIAKARKNLTPNIWKN